MLATKIWTGHRADKKVRIFVTRMVIVQTVPEMPFYQAAQGIFDSYVPYTILSSVSRIHGKSKLLPNYAWISTCLDLTPLNFKIYIVISILPLIFLFFILAWMAVQQAN